LEARRRVQGNDHPATLNARHNLARAASEQGRWAEAEVGFREVLEARRRVLGEDNRDTLATRQELDRVVSKQAGRPKQ
jgi:hypothetical protein